MTQNERFHQISTQWGVMETLLEQDGAKSLADYLAIRYYQPLTEWARKFQPGLDEFTRCEVVSDVFLELIKNNYAKLRTLDKDRDQFRGLLTTILKRKLIKSYKERQRESSAEELSEEFIPRYLDFMLDLENCLTQMQSQRSLAYKAFFAFYLEGKSLKETALELNINENAVAQRLHSARKWLREHLKEY